MGLSIWLFLTILGAFVGVALFCVHYKVCLGSNLLAGTGTFVLLLLPRRFRLKGRK